MDPHTFKTLHTIEVSDSGRAVSGLNELEYINGRIYANVWPTDRIAIIDPADGSVTGWIDLTGILDDKYRTKGADVLNGIAYDRQDDKLLITGKLWPKILQIKPPF